MTDVLYDACHKAVCESMDLVEGHLRRYDAAGYTPSHQECQIGFERGDAEHTVRWFVKRDGVPVEAFRTWWEYNTEALTLQFFLEVVLEIREAEPRRGFEFL